MNIYDKLNITRKIHGRKLESTIIAAQGASEFMNSSSNFTPQNPLTNTGKKVMESMQKEYGPKKAKKVFYSSINAGKKGSKKWHK